MENKHKLLIAVDGSDGSTDAVKYVGHFFNPDAVAVTLIHIMAELPESLEDLKRIETSGTLDIGVDAEQWRSLITADVEKMMTAEQQILIDAGFDQQAVEINIQQRKDGVAKDIIAASADGYDAVFIGRRGADNPDDIIVGATAYRMMSDIQHLPVVVVGDKPDPNHILLGFDGSENAFSAVDCACSLMSRARRKVMLCHVAKSMGTYLDGKSKVISDDQAKALEEQGRQKIKDLMADAGKHLVESGFEANLLSQEILEARVSRAVAIAKTAELQGYGTIVIGRRGLSVIKDFLMGRVSMKVLHRAHEMAVWIV